MYALEGTAFHALAELRARQHLLGLAPALVDAEVKLWQETYGQFDQEVMEDHAVEYVAFLRGRLAETPDSLLLLEQRLPSGVPGCWGTSDAVIVSPTVVEIVDAKYGQGVRVDAAGNAQLRLYGIGALEAYGDLLGVVEVVRCSVFQPRLHHIDTEELPAEELRAWRDSIIPIAELALGDNAPFGPGEEACRWCPVRGQCLAQQAYFTRLDFSEPPELMEEDTLAEALASLPGIRAWCAAVESYCLDRIYSQGMEVPGWKVVMSGSRRAVVDELGAIEVLTNMGFEPPEITTTKVKGIGELEKLSRAAVRDLEARGIIRKSEGKPALAPASDQRPAASAAAQAGDEFK